MAPLAKLSRSSPAGRSPLLELLHPTELPLFRPTCPAGLTCAFGFRQDIFVAGSKVIREKRHFAASCSSSSRQTGPLLAGIAGSFLSDVRIRLLSLSPRLRSLPHLRWVPVRVPPAWAVVRYTRATLHFSRDFFDAFARQSREYAMTVSLFRTSHFGLWAFPPPVADCPE